jgi:two-component system sensor histidine kinase KdpD
MRTPVASILAAASFLRDYEGSPDERREMIASIVDASRTLDGLIEGLLRVARLGSGSESLDLVLAEPREVASRAVSLSGRAGVTVEGSPDLASLAADPERLSRALANLIDNAVKFSPPGSPVVVRVAPALVGQAGAALEAVAFSVLDRGPGPGALDARRRFAPFEQGGDLLTSKPKGVGLGLHEARCIARMHGGSLDWQARPDGGSELCLVIPSRRLPETEAALA